MIGLFTELGPATFPNRDGKPVNNPYSWNTNASVIFIDQPVNTGYSYSGSDVGTTAAAGKDIYALLTLFFNTFPQYAKQDFFITGESYAGHYVPQFASEIMSHNNRNINLKGVAVGNGLTDTLQQFPQYEPMACGRGGYPAVLSQSDCRKINSSMPTCTRKIQNCYNSLNSSTCADANDYCSNLVFNTYQDSGKSVYDIVNPNGSGKSSYYNDFLNSDTTKEALGVEVDRSFQECGDSVYRAFDQSGDWMFPIQRVVPGLLEKIPVLIYAGDYDFICNRLGNR